MRLIRRGLVIALMILLILPVTNAFAYTNDTGSDVIKIYEYENIIYDYEDIDIAGSGVVDVRMYDVNENGGLTGSIDITTSRELTNFYKNNGSNSLKRIELTLRNGTTVNSVKIYDKNGIEYVLNEQVIEDTTPPAEVTNLQQSVDEITGDLGFTYVLPSDSDFNNLKVYINDVVYNNNLVNDSSYYSSGFNYGDVIKVTTVDTSGNESDGVSITLTDPNSGVDTDPPTELTAIQSEVTETSVSFDLSDIANDVESINAYQDGQLVDTLTPDATNYTFSNLASNTSYDFKFTVVDAAGNESSGASETVTTNESLPLGEVKDLEIEAKYDRVDLSWTLPESDKLQHVNIYRDEIVESSAMESIFGVSRVYAATTKIFETNGTYFNDLTVEPEKQYEYTVTTTDTNGIESTGVTVTTSIPKAPPIDFKQMVSLPFNVADLITSSFRLLAFMGGFVLLALAIHYFEPLMRVLRRAAQSYKKARR